MGTAISTQHVVAKQETVCFYLPADNRDWLHPSVRELSFEKLRHSI